MPASNRLEQAIRLTEDINDRKIAIHRDDAPLLERAKDAFRTLWEAFFIVHTVYDRDRTAGTRTTCSQVARFRIPEVSAKKG